MTEPHEDAPEYSTLPLRAVIGEGVRRVRESHGIRQEEVSRAARSYGLTWSRSKVAALERGDKPISADELVLLPLILSAAVRRPVRLPELVDPEVWFRVGHRVMPGRDLVAVLAGRPSFGQRQAAVSLNDVIQKSQHDTATAWDDRTRLIELGLLTDEHGTAELAELEVSLAEERAAARLGERPRVVAYLAQALWGHPLDDERDRVVAEREPDASPDRRRALRGQASRELVEVLADEIVHREQGAATGRNGSDGA